MVIGSIRDLNSKMPITTFVAWTAWEVVEKLGQINSVIGDIIIERDQTMNGVDWMVLIDGREPLAKTAPLAICLAALEAIKST